MLINCGVLIGAAFVKHQVLIAAVVTRDNIRATLDRLHALGARREALGCGRRLLVVVVRGRAQSTCLVGVEHDR